MPKKNWFIIFGLIFVLFMGFHPVRAQNKFLLNIDQRSYYLDTEKYSIVDEAAEQRDYVFYLSVSTKGCPGGYTLRIKTDRANKTCLIMDALVLSGSGKLYSEPVWTEEEIEEGGSVEKALQVLDSL